MLELAQKYRVTEMQVGRGRIEASFDPNGLARGTRFFEPRAQVGLSDDFRGAFFNVGQLFVNGKRRWALS